MATTHSIDIRCDICGRFIGLNDLANERATRKLIYPDSNRSVKVTEWESLDVQTTQLKNRNTGGACRLIVPSQGRLTLAARAGIRQGAGPFHLWNLKPTDTLPTSPALGF